MQGDDRQQDVEQRIAMQTCDAAALAVVDIAGEGPEYSTSKSTANNPVPTTAKTRPPEAPAR